MLATRYVSRNRMSLRKRLSFKRVWHFNTSAVLSDGELSGGGVGDCGSNASLPSVQSHRRQAERSVASWAVCFERLLQDPLGVRYFSEFLKKEFSEENILFWQACEVFSHVSENDKKQLTNRAREIYSSFLSSKATTPVNIDSQAQLADDILNAPRPHMFKEQQLQIFNLMKFDSYTRFLKSRLYQECMLAEVESRPLPEPHHVPASPNSKSSSTTGSSERSALATPKKDDKKSKSGRSLNEDRPEDHADRQRKGMFFSWSRNRSFGKGPKKRDLADFNYNFSGSNGRRESQGSLSSGTSLDLGTSGKNEGDRSAPAEKERGGGAGAPLRQCNISLPDGSCCSVPVRTGVSIRELLQGLCEKLCINLAAVDLFLVGGEKPLVLDQDCITLCSRDLRLEKRTLFRLDLVPINRSVGLKAKPTKPVTEVLRPVVAKYGLHLADLVARISGEKEPLDLGLPISNLDGLRVVLDVADLCPGNDNQNAAATKSNAPPSTLTRSQPATGEERRSGKPSAVRPRGENGKAGPPVPAAGRSSRPLPNHLPGPHHRGPDRKSQAKIKIDEAEEFFDLISKAQSNRADDQRGLLNKSDLQLPEFLRLSPPATDQAPPPYGHQPACSAPHPRRPDDDNGLSGNHRRGNHKESGGKDQDGGGPSHYPDASHQSQSSDSSRGGGVRGGGGGGGRPRPPAPFPGALPPVRPPPAGERARGFPAPQDGSRGEGLREEEVLSDLTLVGEGEISSLHLTPLPPAQRQHDRWPSSGTSPV